MTSSPVHVQWGPDRALTGEQLPRQMEDLIRSGRA
jgi:hypothetical protein